MYITVPLIIFLYVCNIMDYNYMLDCSWSRPIRTKSVFSRLVMFIETKTSNKTVYYNKRK